MQSEIITRDDIQAIYVRQQGAYKESAEKAWQLLCSIAFPLNLVSEDAEFIGISYDDPSFTETSKLRYDACITIAENVSPNAEISVQTIAGGRYAKFSHTGPYTELEKLYNEIHRVWLPQNNHSLADRACFEKYLNSPDDVPPEQLITEIHLPIE